MRALGFNVDEARFFTGTLRTSGGEVVYRAARRKSNELSFETARQLVSISPLLARLNGRYKRNTILLYIAKIQRVSIERFVLRIFTADALARDEGTDALVLLSHPRLFNGDILRSESAVSVYFYGATGTLTAKMTTLPCTLTASAIRLFAWFLQALRLRDLARSHASKRDPTPGLLVLQEDDLSLDRSYRTQPHWLFPDDPIPTFRTFVLAISKSLRLPVNADELFKNGIILLDERERTALRPPPSTLPIYRQLRKDARDCLAVMLRSNSPSEISALGEVWRLLVRTRTLAGLCERLNIRAFMSCENYMIETDAIQLAAPSLGIRTVSYQYSSLPFPSTLMMTTADSLLTFSPLYHHLWSHCGISPGEFVDLGYPFDSSFELVRERSRALRQQLEAAGALFVLCYLDESVQQEKYGCIPFEDHHRELATLAGLVLDDCQLGLVVKSQFTRNTPSRLHGGDPVFAQAAATGRYVELCQGAHRNIVFPAEASLVADITIGHMAGATASLEAALTGQRCVMLNPYPVRGENDHIYAQANVVFPSLKEALAAIHEYRAGASQYKGLGDWSPILRHFDLHHDGKAGRRTRRFLEQLLEAQSAESTSDSACLVGESIA
jgi:hypothetical protein